MTVSSKILYHALRLRLRDLPFTVEQLATEQIRIAIDASLSPKWKQKALQLNTFQNLFTGLPVKVLESEILIEKLPENKWKSFLTTIEKLADLVARENLFDLNTWGIFSKPHSTGFKEGTLPESSNYLKELYADKFIAPEKKGFIIDLRRSRRSHLISADKNAHSFIDAASQIGSLALGYNDPEKRGLLLHPEHTDWSHCTQSSELYKAYQEFLKDKSGLPEAYLFNSGAEANEAAIQLCVRKNPTRKRILAFSGSFHGRSFLTLHLTHSPSKRLPFESYPDLVNFAPFPENKTPYEKTPISEEWRKLWAQAKSPDFNTQKNKLLESADALLKTEIEALNYIKESFDKEEYLVCAIEPRQCEGGDRFASKRFYHALRLLTRAYDVPLLFDEVQTGFGLGGPFFWHEQFDLKTATGERDYPDCVTFAKKGQVAGVLTSLKGNIQHDVSSVSLHRGYIQAMAHLLHPPVDFEYVWKRISEVQSLVGADVLQNPRGQAQTFAFDLPSDTLLNKLISYRFEEGILFYPAGEKTARFRLLRNFQHSEIDSLFTSLYRCFLRASADKLIGDIPPLEKWLEKLEVKNRNLVAKDKKLERALAWADAPKSYEEIHAYSKEQWQNLFSVLLKEQRLCLNLESNQKWSLDKLAIASVDDLIKDYETNPHFTWLDLLWHSSRKLGWKIDRIHNVEDLAKLRPHIEALEAETYEPARQTPYSDFEQCLESSKSVVLVCQDDEEGDLIGLAACCPIPYFKDIKMVEDDPDKNDPAVSYSIEMAVHSSVLNLALGLRLKAEQILELTREGNKAIRSRNRYPLASGMIRLNHGFGSVVRKIGHKIYSDGGSAFYQSLKLNSFNAQVWNARHPSMINKGSLANFVSPAYVDNMLIIKELLPTAYKHVYLASSRGEALDKAIKCLRHTRAKGQLMFGLDGHNFGNTTASTATLSGETHYFEWPRFTSIDDKKINEWLEKNSEKLLGCALEYRGNVEETQKQIAFLKSKGIASILKECQSVFWKGSKESFILSGTQLDPDIVYFGIGPQVAVVACKENIFIDKALTMISTWDGDEHGLCLFQDHVFERLEEVSRT